MTVSLFIILLAFFILLNTLAVPDEARQRLALGSLMRNFGVLSGGVFHYERRRPGDNIRKNYPDRQSA